MFAFVQETIDTGYWCMINVVYTNCLGGPV